MHAVKTDMIYGLLEPLLMLLGMIFIFAMLIKDREEAPLSLPMTVLCVTLCGLFIYGFRHGTNAAPGGWPLAISICIGFLAWGLWELRHLLFGSLPADAATTAPNGQSIAGNVLIAMTEEWLFRGWIQTSLFGIFAGPSAPVMALFVTNLLFALMHASRGITFALSAGFFGMIMSMTVIFSGSIWPAVITHALWNLMVGIARLRSCQPAPTP